MTKHDDDPDLHGGRLRVPRSRGALSGLLLIVLGAWGALVPLLGPYADFGYRPDKSFDFTKARWWLEILPGAVTVVGGILLLVAANRVVASLGGWLGVAGGAWFVVGPTLDRPLHLGAIGSPIHTSTAGSTLETLLLFTGLGALVVLVAALAVGRLGVVGVRDVRAAQRREQELAREQAEQQAREQADRDARERAERETQAREQAERDAREQAERNAAGGAVRADTIPQDAPPQTYSVPPNGAVDPRYAGSPTRNDGPDGWQN